MPLTELKNAKEVHRLLQDLIDTEERYDLAKERFRAKAKEMSSAVKCEVDRLIVKQIAVVYRTTPHVSERGKFSGWTFEKEAARRALSRARKFLSE